jgi:glycerol-1-phosphate dehydrogenase [NAD(P)+]
MKNPIFSKALKDLVTIGEGRDFAAKSLKGLNSKNILFISDEKIWKNCQKFFPQGFAKLLLLKNPKADEENLKIIAKNLKNIDLILCLGSGTISDLCKFTSAKKNIPYAIFPSAASMNGYLSKNASITIKGHKKTLPATLPIQVFCNLDILKSAPIELTKAGIGDSLCFYSCWFDWYLSHKILGTKFDKKPFALLQPKMDFLLKNYQNFSLQDEELLKILIEILLLSGLGMTIAGGSYPASQSEHMIAHTIDMKYPKKFEKLLHGQVIAVTSLTAAKLQGELLKTPFDKLRVTLEDGVRVTLEGGVSVEGLSVEGVSVKDGVTLSLSKGIQNFFGKKIVVECLKEYKEKLSLLKNAKKLNAKTIKELQKIHFCEKELKAVFSHFKIKTSAKSLGLSGKEYQACIAFAKFTRNRFTCLDF